MKKIRVNLIAYIVVFALMLALPIVTMNRIPGKISETEKRYLATFPTVFDGEGHLSSGLKNGFETWLGDNLGFRDDFMKIAANIKLKLFHQSTSEQVEIGRDGWYFYTPDSNLDIARGEYPNFDEGILQTICREQEMIRDKLAAQGIEYALILPPSKASIYPEYISSGEYEVTKTPVDMLADYLEEHSDIKVIRLKDALLEAKENEQLYYKTDTHWNQQGAYVAYQKIIKDMNSWGLCSSELEDVTFVPSYFTGEFGAMLGYEGVLAEEQTAHAILAQRDATECLSGETYDRLSNAVIGEGIPTQFHLYANEKSVDDASVLLFGDSMMAEREDPSLAELLAENFFAFTYVWDYGVRQSIIDAVQPDILLYEMTERHLNNFMLTKNLDFIKNPLADFEAEVVDYTIGEDSVHVTVKNTSSSAWRFEDFIRCCIWENGIDNGIRANLPMNSIVMPGETVEFVFEDIDIGDLLGDQLEVVMVQEGITFFGDRKILE